MASPRVVLVAASAAQAATAVVGFGLPALSLGLRREFDLSLAELGAVLTAHVLGSGLTLIAAGVAVDRYGGRAAMLAGTLLATTSLVGAAFAPSALLLVVALFVSGVGASVVPIAGAGALFRAFRPERRGLALGIRQMAVSAGGAVAAVLLPGLEDLGGVEAALLGAAALEGAAGMAFALVAGNRPPPGERLGLEVRRVWRAPGLRRLLVVAACYIVVLSSFVTYLVPAAKAAGFSSFVAGAVFLAINITGGVARLVWGRLADRRGGNRRVRTLVEAGLVASVGGLLFAAALHGSAALVFVAAIFFAFGALGWNALIYVTAGEQAPPPLAGQAVAVAATAVFVLAAVSTPPMGALAEHAGWDAFWAVTASFAAVGALVAATLPRRRAAV